MKINITDTIIGLDGQPLRSEEKDLNLTWRELFNAALNYVRPDENPTADEKAKRFEVMTKLFDGDQADLTINDATIIKERVGVSYAPLVVGLTNNLFEQVSSTTEG